MKSRQLITGALLSMCILGPAAASATRTNLGTLPDGDFGIVGSALGSQSFQDTIHVIRTSASELDGSGAPARLITADWSLSKVMASLKGSALASGRHTFADLTPDSYEVAIFGPQNNPGGYAANYRASVAAVPEIETWLMLLIGLGLAAYQLHRKQKALGQQVLDVDAMSSASA